MSSHSVVSSEGWLSRLGNSFKGIVVGIILILIAVALLWWNEKRAVYTARALEEGAGVVQTVPTDRIDTANEGKLVHFTGTLAPASDTSDPEFLVRGQWIRLVRTVEMFQWIEESSSETKNKLGGGTETVTTYTYKKEWREGHVDSGRFNKPDGHTNPPSLPFDSANTVSSELRVGAWTIPSDWADSFGTPAVHKLSDADLAAMPEPIRASFRLVDGALYKGTDPAAPAIGDVRITFKTVGPSDATAVGQQLGTSVRVWTAKNGTGVSALEPRIMTAEAYFQKAQDDNATMTWILRFVGFLLCFFGFQSVFGPLGVIGDVVPFIGSIVRFGTGIFAFFFSASISTVVIAIAWIFYRPLLAIGLLAAAGAIIAGVWYLVTKKRAEGGATPRTA